MSKNRIRRVVVQGGRGAISLFLAVLLTPFLTVAMLMVEVQKYNSSVSVMDEAMGVSATSVLADYDEFLIDRWGLTAVSQGTDIESAYSEVLGVNSCVLGKSITLNSVSASGMQDSSIANSSVLYNQVQEFSKLNAPVTLANEVLNLSDLIASLEKIKSIDHIANMVSGLTDTADSMIDFGTHADSLKEASKALDSRSSDLDKQYAAFRDAANGLIDACVALEGAKKRLSERQQEVQAANNTVKSYEKEVEGYQTQIDERKEKQKDLASESDEFAKLQTEIDEYQKKIDEVKKAHKSDYKAVKKAESNVKDARQKVADQERALEASRAACSSTQQSYSSSIKSAQEELATYLSKVKACNDDLEGVYKSVSEAVKGTIAAVNNSDSEKESLEKANSDLANLKSEKGETSAEYLSKVQERDDLMSDLSEIDVENTINDAVNKGVKSAAKEWKETISENWEEKVSACVTTLTSIKANVDNFPTRAANPSTAKVTKSSYYQSLSSSGYVSADNIDAYLDKLKKESFEGSLSSFIDGMMAAFDAIFSINLFWDGDLSSCIDTDYYSREVGGLPGSGMSEGGVLAIITDVAEVIKASEEFGTSIASLNFLGAWKAVKTFAQSCSSFVTDTTDFVTGIGQNVVDLFSNYERLYYSTYSAFNTTCRVDLKSVMSGGTPTLEDKDFVGPSATRDLVGLVSTLRDLMNRTGSDKAFCGAELEYILFGSTSEIANQLYTFSGIYLIRLISGLAAISLNAEVQAMAASATIGAPVVLLVLYLLEPLVDTILLVNGEDVALYETTIHLTPSGIPSLCKALINIGAQEMAQAMEGKVKSAFDVNDETYKAELNKRTGSGDSSKATSDPSTGKISKAWSSYTGGFLSFSYREYCFMLLLATVGKDAQMARLENLIQMEGTLHYQKVAAPYAFDLKKSYTFIQAEADISVKQLLPSLTDSRWFTIKRTQYRGY